MTALTILPHTPIVIQVVNQGSSTTTVTNSPSSTTYGQTVTFTANVAAVYPASGTPTGGTVTFYDGMTSIGTATLSNGTASLLINTLNEGSHSISAVWAGSANYTGSTSSAIGYTVNGSPLMTATLASLTQSPTEYGQPITLQAIIQGSVTGPATPASGTLYSPSGTVAFFANPNIPLGSVAIAATTTPSTISSPTLTISLPTLALLPAGSTYTFSFTFTPDTTNYLAAISNTISQTIIETPTTTVMTPNPTSDYGCPVTFTATVTSQPPGAGIPTGLVIFYNGTTLLGNEMLDNTGMASLTVAGNPPYLNLGSNLISAVYVQDGNYSTSTATPITHAVTQGTSTTVALTSSENPSNFGDSIILTATVTPGCSSGTQTGVPSGTVTFYAGATVIGTGTLSGTAPGPYVATLSICRLYPATYNLKAIYRGDAEFYGALRMFCLKLYRRLHRYRYL